MSTQIRFGIVSIAAAALLGLLAPASGAAEASAARGAQGPGRQETGRHGQWGGGSQGNTQRGEERIEALARQLEADGDLLHARIDKLIKKPTGLVRDIVQNVQNFENAADHYRNDVVNRGAYSTQATNRLKTARSAWQKVLDSYRHLPNDRELTTYRTRIGTTFNSLQRLYDDDRGPVSPMPLTEIVSQASQISSRSDRLLQMAREEAYGNERNRNVLNNSINRLAEIRSRASTLQRSTRNRPYRDAEVRRNLQDLQDAYALASRPAANFSGRLREQYRALGQAIDRLERLLRTGRNDRADAGSSMPNWGDGLVSPVWRSENMAQN